MDNQRFYQVTLRLDDVKYLFLTSDVTPFSPNYRENSYTTGIEYLVNELYSHSSAKSVRLTLQLPRAAITPGLEQEVREAVARYCRARMKESNQERAGLRQRTIRGGVIVAFGLFVFLFMGNRLAESPLFMLQSLSELLIIVGWIAVWGPVDTLIFETRNHRLDRDLYKKLIAMPVTIVPAD